MRPKDHVPELRPECEPLTVVHDASTLARARGRPSQWKTEEEENILGGRLVATLHRELYEQRHRILRVPIRSNR